MALWKEQDNTARREADRSPTPAATPPSLGATIAPVPEPANRPRAAEKTLRESVIAPEITIEGKIEGAGHVRIGGRFKGDVNVQGDLTIEAGAHLTGQVQAKNVVVGGELHGNIVGAERIELLASGLVNGDVKAGALVVAAGSRMRGQVEFGWKDRD
jgi:cytoskeletal protein CcmA (bactofilin family)